MVSKKKEEERSSEVRVIYQLTADDFNSVAMDLIGRSLTTRELDECERKFCIDGWAEEVFSFLESELGLGGEECE